MRMASQPGLGAEAAKTPPPKVLMNDTSEATTGRLEKPPCDHSQRYARPAFNARHADPLRLSAAAVVLLLRRERFTRIRSRPGSPGRAS